MNYKFDFGVAEKKNYDGSDVTRIFGKTVYDEAKGFGLTKEAEGVSREHDNEYLKDFLYMGDNSFKVKLPEGKYNVKIYSGDYDALNDFSVLVRVCGERKAGIWVNDNSVNERTTVINVEGGIITEFEFSSKNGMPCVNAIEIADFIDEPPVNLACAVNVYESGQEVSLSWDCLPDASGYVVCAYHYESDITKEYFCKENKYTDKNVELCEEYVYTVYSVDRYGFKSKSGVSANVAVVDGNALPEKPTNLTAETSDNQVALKWNAVPGALGYVVYQKAKYGLYKKLAVVKDTAFTDNDVLTSVVFTYAVSAVTKSGLTEKAEVKTPSKRTPFKRKMETLDRGFVALKTDKDSEKGMFLSWRLNAYEYEKGINFNIYKNGVKLNGELITNSTNYIDGEGTPADIYTVKAVLEGKEEKTGVKALMFDKEYLSVTVDKPAPYTTPDGVERSYTINDISVADLDGDGEYELILKWDCNGKDNSHSGYSGIVYIDAYKINGKKMWRIDLGVNIRAGAHYTQFMVYDFDGDGKAEVIFKTADGTTDSKGTVIGDKNADYRDERGFILQGPEFLSLFDGETGVLLDTVDYDPSRGKKAEYGDSSGNRVDRYLACVAYLDGENPSAVMCRGYYDRGRPSNLVAYDVVNKKLVKRWKFRADATQNIAYTNQGNHNIAVGDIDGDGRDEIVYGACAIDHDGTGVYSTRLGHGDALHFGKFNPNTEGYDFMQIHEHADCPHGLEVRNPATGEVLWGKFVGLDTGRGITAKVDPRYVGNQVWANHVEGIYSYEGEQISTVRPKTANFAIWWDGDLLRELLDHKWSGYGIETIKGLPENKPAEHALGPDGKPVRPGVRGSGKGIGIIQKWDWLTEELVTVLDTVDSYSINGTKGNPCIQADIFGDWREEAIWRNEDDTELRIYTTNHITEHKFYTLMHDPVYRQSVAFQNTAYNQPPHTGFYIGNEMGAIPIPNNTYVNGANLPEFEE